VVGDLSWADARALAGVRLEGLAIAPSPEGTVAIDLELAGASRELEVRGTLLSPRIRLLRADGALVIDVLDAHASLERRPDALEAELTAKTSAPPSSASGSELSIGLVLRDGHLDGTSCSAELDLGDLARLGAYDASLLEVGGSRVHVEAAISGAARRALVVGMATADVLRTKRAGAPEGPVVLTDVSGLFRLDPDAALWNDVRARVGEGELSSSGVVTRASETRALLARAELEDIALEDLPFGLARWVTGRAAGAVRVRSVNGSRRAWGRIELEEAFFPVLARTRPMLASYGLEPPHPRANGPAELTTIYAEGAFSVQLHRASVPGCSATGAVRIGPDRALDGHATVTLDGEYLGTSPILVLPAVLTETLTVPVRIGGTLGEPRVTADLAALLGRFMTDNRVSSFVSDAAAEVAALFAPLDASSAPASTPEPSSAEAAAALGAELDHELGEALGRAKADWEPIRTRLAEHRRRLR
jgi:hypothetical protein